MYLCLLGCVRLVCPGSNFSLGHRADIEPSAGRTSKLHIPLAGIDDLISPTSISLISQNLWNALKKVPIACVL